MKSLLPQLIILCIAAGPSVAETPRKVDHYPHEAPRSSWDDLTVGVQSAKQWQAKRETLRSRYLELLRDQHKPARPPLDLKVLESTVVDGCYERKLISYQVDANERAHAYLGIPLKLQGKAAGIVALHGTYAQGIDQAAGLVDNPEKAYLDHLCRRGYVVIAPEHFVSGRRTPAAGPYDTAEFYRRHPQWTAVGKFTYEHSIAVDVLASLPEVDADRIGVMGHSLGGQGAMFLAAYDERIKAAACNCSASFFRHNPKVDHWARDHWYVYFKHIRPGLLKGELPPIDFHEIMSLVAPRAFLDVSALNDGDPLVQRQRVLMLTSVMGVYDLLDASQNFAFFVHGRGHSVPHESRELIYSWLDAHLLPAESTKATLVGEQAAGATR
jgi:pimeloyl-ACP methyl ester carboxylesterase